MSEGFELKDSTVLHRPELHSWVREDLHYYLDPEGPNWVSTDDRGARILELADGKNSFNDIVRRYSEAHGIGISKSWLHAHTFLKDAIDRGIVRHDPAKAGDYRGREHYLKTDNLKEFWIHLTQTCNLTCSHCLVSSGPDGVKGPDTEFYRNAIEETVNLGVQRYYFTGGEPFVRQDIFDLIREITETRKKELIILTNATLFEGNRLEQLKTLDPSRLKFQVSIDGTSAPTNDAIRGHGVFEKSSRGLRTLAGLGFETSLTAVVTRSNLKELESLPSLAKSLGAKSVHLMWLHRRGRILESNGSFPTNSELLDLCRSVKRNADRVGILFDNVESLRLRVNGHPFVKYDLGNLCWESLCLYVDGEIYPSAAMAGQPSLSLGRLNGKSVGTLWRESATAKKIRSASVLKKERSSRHPFRYLTGGGDIEHSYFFSSNGKEGSFNAEDPYYDLYVELMKDLMEELAVSKKESANRRSGFNSPHVIHAMGEDAIACSEDAQDWLGPDGLPPVRLLHSNCVLSFDVEKPYRAMQRFYGNAAEKPQKDLCCPIKYDDAEVGHIPQEVLDRFYGCGSPISIAQVRPGESLLDLGSGAGIDCFIAAKKVGPEGKVIGVDMTRQMLGVAERSREAVAKNLQYDVVEFREGYLEKIPAEDRTIDLVTSNCVINLSPDKKKVFAEIWRVLKDTGRLVVADIVSDRPVPLPLQAHQELWGECISGSLSEDQFLSSLEKAGFYGISLLKKTFWKEVEGVKFYSITVQGFKFEKKAGCDFIGQKAVYLGPYKAVTDEEGHLFPRGEAVEVCTDTAAKLKARPYSERFAVIDPKSGAGIRISIAAEEPVDKCCDTSGCC